MTSNGEPPKEKMNWVDFLNDFHNLNMQLKSKPYLMPKIQNLLKLESFKYDMFMDLNMGDYFVCLRKEAFHQ